MVRGLLVFNVSNRHLDLRPALYHLTQNASLVGRYCADEVEDDPHRFASTWVVLARREADLGQIATEARWHPLMDKSGTSLWTDNFSNLFRVVYWW